MLAIENLCKQFHGHDGQLVKAIDNISLHIESGKLYTMLGPSGCGKTTTLRSIAGLERPDSGMIQIYNEKVFDSKHKLYAPPEFRGIGMVFQSYAIWPHMNVFENVAFPIKQLRPKVPKKEVAERVKQALKTIQLDGYETRSATKLSGGQQQRLALARAIVHQPKLLLLDEPLSNLDAKLREKMRFEIKKLQRELGITTVYVTHDQDEALALSDQIVVMHGGKIVQTGTPWEIYQRPKNQFIADFIGLTNFVTGHVQAADAAETTRVVKVGSQPLRCTFVDAARSGSEAVISIRPENVVLAKPVEGDIANEADREDNRFAGIIEHRVFLGQHIDYIVNVKDVQQFRVRCHPDQGFEPGEEVVVRIHPSKCIALTQAS